MIIIVNKGWNNMSLYHGLKNGIKGAIRPDAGRAACDFGNGFRLPICPTKTPSRN